MTEKKYQEIVARQAQPQFGVPSQTMSDVYELIAELQRRTQAGDAAFEPEPKTEEELAAEAEEASKKTTKRR